MQLTSKSENDMLLARRLAERVVHGVQVVARDYHRYFHRLVTGGGHHTVQTACSAGQQVGRDCFISARTVRLCRGQSLSAAQQQAKSRLEEAEGC